MSSRGEIDGSGRVRYHDLLERMPAYKLDPNLAPIPGDYALTMRSLVSNGPMLTLTPLSEIWSLRLWRRQKILVPVLSPHILDTGELRF